MKPYLNRTISQARRWVDAIASGPQVLAFLPAVVLAGYWIGGEGLLLATALGFPVLLTIMSGIRFRQCASIPIGTCDNRNTAQVEFEYKISQAIEGAKKKSWRTACFIVELDDFDAIEERYGRSTAETVMRESIKRLQQVLRSHDQLVVLGDKQIGVSIAPVARLDLDLALQMAIRLQQAVEEPLAHGSSTIYVSVSIGLAMDTNFKNGSGKDLAEAAQRAYLVARHNSPSAIRAYSPDMRDIKAPGPSTTSEIEQALENGEIQPWFQPQISTDTGHVTGFEALARWVHPQRGPITPVGFLPVIQQEGKMERLGEVMLSGALNALKNWDQLGLDVPHVGVNFSPDELRNPKLREKIEWELDRFDLTPDRLAVEILETVVATSPDDAVTRNISRLSGLGCFIDLDDFGTGHASISSIRRFAIQRLKIDRSFVMKVDQDAEQQRMVSAILLMAERLELDTLAEGVETAGEHAMLAQLGCRHVQGFGIGRPMPFQTTKEWIKDHNSRVSTPPVFGRNVG